MSVQDTTYSNVSAVNLFWAFDDGLAVAEGTTGADDGVYTPERGSVERAANLTALSRLPPAQVVPPGPEDAWFAIARSQLVICLPSTWPPRLHNVSQCMAPAHRPHRSQIAQASGSADWGNPCSCTCMSPRGGPCEPCNGGAYMHVPIIHAHST